MTQAPAKWRKYKLLETWELKPKGELESEIQRYNMDDYPKMFKDIELDMYDTNYKNAYIGICVPQHRISNLPNLKMQHPDDILKAEEYLEKLGRDKFVEIWCIKNSMEKEKLLFGRQAFFLDCLYPRIAPSIIECIEGENISARDIDSANRFIEVPNKVKRFLGNRRKRILEFGDFLKSAGNTQYAIEFKSVDGKLSIIDWDIGNFNSLAGLERWI
jgi:hypothetical protein